VRPSDRAGLPAYLPAFAALFRASLRQGQGPWGGVFAGAADEPRARFGGGWVVSPIAFTQMDLWTRERESP
jgi:hypothetical protein